MHEANDEMNQILVDEETGESLIQPLPQGETSMFVDSVNNVETGEPEVVMDIGLARRRTPFQIPREIREGLSSKDGTEENGDSLMEIEPVPVGASFGQINPICLFLPAIIYFRWFLTILLLFEALLHVWAHHKNKSLTDTNVYFRSPFHGISSEFCALCQSEKCMDRVGKIQEIRMHKFLRQCNYMKRVVT